MHLAKHSTHRQEKNQTEEHFPGSFNTSRSLELFCIAEKRKNPKQEAELKKI
jgi:hypothetical protein